MAYQVKISQQAEEELDEIFSWYEKKRSGLGVDFLNYFLDQTTYLKDNPHLYQKVYKAYRRALMQKYPYGIYYIIEEQQNKVIVIAIWHTHRNPKRLKNKLK